MEGGSLLQRRQKTRAKTKSREVDERFLRLKSPDPIHNDFIELKLDRKTEEPTSDSGPKPLVKRLSKPAVPSGESPIFPIVIDKAVSKKLPEGYHIRSLQRNDFHKGYTKLKGIGSIDLHDWNKHCEYSRSRSDVYTILVITDDVGSICSTGTLVLERKLTIDLPIIGHIRDIVVADTARGKNLSYRMLGQLERLAYSAGAAQTVASTQVANVPFFQQRGFKQTGVELTRSFLVRPDLKSIGEELSKSRSPSFERLDRELALAAVRFGATETTIDGSGNGQVAWSPVLE